MSGSCSRCHRATDGLTIELAALVLFPFFVAALFLVVERVALLWQRLAAAQAPATPPSWLA